MPKLIIKKGDQLVRKISVPEDILAFTVGSEQGNDIILDDERISFFHLQFEKQGPEYYVRDLQSEWGTFVNGERIASRTYLQDRDVISIGFHTLTFVHPESQAADVLPARGSDNADTAPDADALDRISGVPNLDNLNSWLKQDPTVASRNGNLTRKPQDIQQTVDLLEVEENGPSEFESPRPHRTQAKMQMPKPHFEPEPEPTPPRESELDFQTSSILQTEPTPPPQTILDEPTISLPAPESAADIRPPSYYLVGIYGYYIGRKFKIKYPETKIGRDRRINDIVIKRNSRGRIDPSVSRQHAKIEFKNNRYVISDHKSKSRTYVNQTKLEKEDEVVLHQDDEIEIVSDRKSHIFRVVEGGDWDFSFPRKAGVWHIRYRTLIANIYSAIVVLLACLFFAKSFMARNVIMSKPDPLVLSRQAWYPSGSNGASADLGSEFGCFPAIADLNGDKIADLVYSDSRGVLKSIDGNTREILWTNEEFRALPNVPVKVEDLNQDRKPDVVVVSEDWRLRAIDGSWGIEIWKSPILEGPLVGPPVIGDFNGDRLNDLAIASEAGGLYIGYSSLVNSRWIKIDLPAETKAIASAGYLKSRAIPTIAVGTESGRVLLIDGEAERIVNDLDINETLNKATGSFGQNNQIRYPVAFGELDGDGVNDLVIYTQQGNVLAFSGANMQRLWYSLDTAELAEPAALTSGIAVGDLDGDRLMDVALVSPQGKLQTLKGLGLAKDRKMELWQKPNATFAGSPILTDFNKSGAMDVMVFDRSGNIFIFEGLTGEVLWEDHGNRATMLGGPVIGDVDADYNLDVIAPQADGRLYHLRSNSRAYDKPLVWSQVFANSRNSNSIRGTQPDTRRYLGNMGISLLLILLVACLQFMFRYRRARLAKTVI